MTANRKKELVAHYRRVAKRNNISKISNNIVERSKTKAAENQRKHKRNANTNAAENQRKRKRHAIAGGVPMDTRPVHSTPNYGNYRDPNADKNKRKAAERKAKAEKKRKAKVKAAHKAAKTKRMTAI